MSINIVRNIETPGFALMLTFTCVIFLGIFTQSCSNETLFDDEFSNKANKISNMSEIEITDFKEWFNSQNIANGLIDKKNLDWDNAEIKLMPDGKSKKVSFVIYQGKSLLGNDSIRELQVAYVGNGFIGGVKVFSFSSDKEYADAAYYNLAGRLLQEGIYYANRQQFIVLMRYEVERGMIRLKTGSGEYNEQCDGTQKYTDSETPIERDASGNIINSAANDIAYNCHSYIWGSLSSNDPCYIPNLPNWNNCPNIRGSGWREVGEPQVGDRCVSYGYDPEFGDSTAIHSAKVLEVTNGEVTKIEAKCGDKGVYVYHPDCDAPLFAGYKTETVKYFRE